MRLKIASLFILSGDLYAKDIVVSCHSDSRIINYGLSKLNETSAAFGSRVVIKPLQEYSSANIVAVVKTDIPAIKLNPGIAPRLLKPEGFQIIRTGKKTIIVGADEKGVMRPIRKDESLALN